MKWQIVILNDYSVELVPVKFLDKDGKTCWIPAEIVDSDNFDTAVKNLEESKDAEDESATENTGKNQNVRFLLEEFDDYRKGIEKLKELCEGIKKRLKKSNDYDENSDQLDDLAAGIEGLDLAESEEEVSRDNWYIDRRWQSSMQIRTGFQHFVSRFFESCKNAETRATFWITKLTRTRDNVCEDIFAAGKMDTDRHVEVVFKQWWQKQEGKGYSCDKLEVYTNYTPCCKCASKLKKWLEERPSIKLSINYAFVYIFWKYFYDTWRKKTGGSGSQFIDIHMIKLKKLSELENLVEIKKLDETTLKNLAKEVGFNEVDYEYKIPDYGGAKYETQINYQRPTPTSSPEG